MAGSRSDTAASSFWHKIRLWFTFQFGSSIATTVRFEDQQVELLKGKKEKDNMHFYSKGYLSIPTKYLVLNKILLNIKQSHIPSIRATFYKLCKIHPRSPFMDENINWLIYAGNGTCHLYPGKG